MKKLLIIMLTVAFLMSVAISGISCKAEEVTEEVTEEVAEAVEEAVEEVAEEVEEAVEEEPAGKIAEGMKITFITPLVAHPVWDESRLGFEDAAAELGFEASYVGPQGIDPVEMLNMMDIAIAEGVDGIITMAMNSETWIPALEKAEEAGVTVVLVGSDSTGPRLGYLGTNTKALGNNGANEYVAELARRGWEPKAVSMQSTMDANFANEVREAYVEILDDVDGFELYAIEECQSDMLTAVQKYENLFRTYPDTNIVICCCGEAGPAAAKVAEEMGRTEDMVIIAIDDVAETLDWVKKGVLYGTMAQNFYSMGYVGSKMILDSVLNGIAPELDSTDTGSFFVSLDNIDTYKAAMAEFGRTYGMGGKQ